MDTLGQRIVKVRVDKRMRQKDLCKKTGLSQRYVSVLELDKADPRISVVRKIAAALGVPLGEFINDTKDSPIIEDRQSRHD